MSDFFWKRPTTRSAVFDLHITNADSQAYVAWLKPNNIKNQYASVVKQFYQETFGKTLTDAEIIASAIDPQISQDLQTGAITGADIISQNILRAEIGGEALLAGVDIDVQQAEQLRQQGLSRQQARQECERE